MTAGAVNVCHRKEELVIRVALAQQTMSPNMGDNLQNSLELMEAAADQKADIIVFPEVQLSPFFAQYPDYDAAPYLIDIDHEYIQRLNAACARLQLIGAFNVYLSEGGEAYDASILTDKKGRILGISKMTHITQAPHFYEQNYYAPSKEGFLVHETPIGKIGIVICFDRHFPESIRSCVLQGAEIVLIPTANHQGEPLEMFDWEMRVTAFQNSVYIAMCNRVGKEGEIRYCGRSIVVDPKGDIVLRADNEAGLFTADIDLQAVKQMRKNNKFLEIYRPSVFHLQQSNMEKTASVSIEQR